MSGRTSTSRPSAPTAYRSANSPSVSSRLLSKSNPAAGSGEIRRVATSPGKRLRTSAKALAMTGSCPRLPSPGDASRVKPG
jgi:hypothetical protein